jgi:hypothetical protein
LLKTVKITEIKKNPANVDLQGFSSVWVERFELSAS